MKASSILVLLIVTLFHIFTDAAKNDDVIYTPPFQLVEMPFNTYLMRNPGSQIPIPEEERLRIAEAFSKALFTLSSIQKYLINWYSPEFSTAAAILPLSGQLRVVYVARLANEMPGQSVYQFSTQHKTETVNINTEILDAVLQNILIFLTPQINPFDALQARKEIDLLRLVVLANYHNRHVPTTNQDDQLFVFDEQAPANMDLVKQIHLVLPKMRQICAELEQLAQKDKINNAAEIKQLIYSLSLLREVRIQRAPAQRRRYVDYVRFRLSSYDSGFEVMIRNDVGELTAGRLLNVICRLLNAKENTLRSIRYFVDSYDSKVSQGEDRNVIAGTLSAPLTTHDNSAMNIDDHEAAAVLMDLATAES